MNNPLRDGFTAANALGVAQAVRMGTMSEAEADRRDPNWRAAVRELADGRPPVEEPTMLDEVVVNARRPNFLARQLNRARYGLEDMITGGPGSADGNDTSFYQLGAQYLTGAGPRKQVFHGHDPATNILRQDPTMARLRGRIADGDYEVGKIKDWDRSLGGVQGIREYVPSYTAIPTGGRVGNLADGYLGSYDGHFMVRDVDPDGIATVDVHVGNDSDLKSLTHPPLLGYTDWWQDTIEPFLMRRSPKAGPLAPTRQDFYWTEQIPTRKRP